jgi:hypothetical protein
VLEFPQPQRFKPEILQPTATLKPKILRPAYSSHPTTNYHTLPTTPPAPSTRNPTSYTLHPTPYTLHPAFYPLHPTPYTLHPTPYTLHPTPLLLYSNLWQGEKRTHTHTYTCNSAIGEEDGQVREGTVMADARARASPHTPRELTTARVQMRAQQRRKLRSALMLCSRHVSAPGMLSRVCASTRGADRWCAQAFGAMQTRSRSLSR